MQEGFQGIPQRTRTLRSPFIYARIALSIDTETAVSPSLFQDVAAEALRQLYGYVGGAVETHVLAVSGIEVTIKVDQRDWKKLWSALTLLTHYQSIRSKFEDALQVMSSSEQPPSAGLRSTNSTSQRSPFKPYVSDSKLQAESQPLLPVSAQPVQIAYRPSAVTGFIVFAWFTSNIGLLLMNKYLLSNYGFKQPVFLTVCHMFACVVLSTAFSTTTVVPRRSIQSTQQLAKIAVLATVFVLSVVLGNISLKYIPVSFSQAIGATTPAFTALLSLLMLRSRETGRTYVALLPVVIGVVIATGAEPSFNLAGFSAAVVATSARAFKSVLQGVLLTDPSENMDSMNLLKYMSPIAMTVLLPATWVLEPDVFALLRDSRRDYFFIAFLSLNAVLAYFVNLLNFLVTRYTSALTLQVLGNGKGVAAVVVSVMVFRNPVTVASIGGYFITVSGVVYYMFAKRSAAAANSAANSKAPTSSAV